MESRTPMQGHSHRGAPAMLWLTAAIWGFAFVAQRAGMQFIGPFSFNGIRFLLGSLSLVPLIYYFFKKGSIADIRNKKTVLAGLASGLVLFTAASFQQVGMVTTTAGKAGFITGFYVVLVPVIGIFIGQKITRILWIGAFVALAGLYLLTINGPLVVERGDMLVLISAVCWAVHVQLINWLVKTVHPLVLSAFQFSVCGLLCLAIGLAFEPLSIAALQQAALPLLYGGLISVGIAYTLQVVAQQFVHPAYASIILSLETVFAVIGGYIILHETMSMRNLAGCILMLAGILIVQLWGNRKR